MFWVCFFSPSSFCCYVFVTPIIFSSKKSPYQFELLISQTIFFVHRPDCHQQRSMRQRHNQGQTGKKAPPQRKKRNPGKKDITTRGRWRFAGQIFIIQLLIISENFVLFSWHFNFTPGIIKLEIWWEERKGTVLFVSRRMLFSSFSPRVILASLLDECWMVHRMLPLPLAVENGNNFLILLENCNYPSISP